MADFKVLKGGFTVQYLLPCEGGYLVVETGEDKEFSLFLRKLELV